MKNNKLLIVGDSFGCSLGSKGIRPWFEHPELEKNYHITNLSVPGNSQQEIHKDFLKNYFHFEKIIYIITSTGRHTWTDHRGIKHYITGNISSLERFIDLETDKDVKEKLIHIKSYYLNFFDKDVFRYATLGMLTDVKNIKADTILLPGFSYQEMPDLKNIESGFSLSRIADAELKAFKLEHDTMGPERRPAHLTQENNDILAQWIIDTLAGSDRQLKTDDFIIPKYEEKFKYFSQT